VIYLVAEADSRREQIDTPPAIITGVDRPDARHRRHNGLLHGHQQLSLFDAHYGEGDLA
jgi:hypothetical protein